MNNKHALVLMATVMFFLQIYKLAAGNIYDNTREMVPRETLRTLVSKMLDEVSIHGYHLHFL